MDAWEVDPFDHRRRYARRDVRLKARVRAGGRELPATTENISPGGAFFLVELPETMHDFVATIELPEGRGLHVRARVRWRRREEPAGIGVQFETFLADPWDELSRSA